MLSMIGIQSVIGVLLVIRSVQSCAFQTINGILNHDVLSGMVLIDCHSIISIVIMSLLYSHALLNVLVSSGVSNVSLVTGSIILILGIACCFTGYSLTGGNMSYWAVTVILSMTSVLPYGDQMLSVLYGSSVVCDRTFSLLALVHYVLPIMIIVCALMHMIVIHETNSDRLIDSHSHSFSVAIDLFIIRDCLSFICIGCITAMVMISSSFGAIWCLDGISLHDVSNYDRMNSMVTPVHIQPE